MRTTVTISSLLLLLAFAVAATAAEPQPPIVPDPRVAALMAASPQPESEDAIKAIVDAAVASAEPLPPESKPPEPTVDLLSAKLDEFRRFVRDGDYRRAIALTCIGNNHLISFWRKLNKKKDDKCALIEALGDNDREFDDIHATAKVPANVKLARGEVGKCRWTGPLIQTAALQIESGGRKAVVIFGSDGKDWWLKQYDGQWGNRNTDSLKARAGCR